MGIVSLLTGPIKTLFSDVTSSVKQFITTDKDRLEAQQKLADLEAAFQTKLGELDVQFGQMQRDVIVAEANGHSWLQRNWRPVSMLTMVGFIGYILFTGGYVNGHELNQEFVMEILKIIQYGFSGYVAGRSLEKVAPHIADIFSKKK